MITWKAQVLNHTIVLLAIEAGYLRSKCYAVLLETQVLFVRLEYTYLQIQYEHWIAHTGKWPMIINIKLERCIGQQYWGLLDYSLNPEYRLWAYIPSTESLGGMFWGRVLLGEGMLIVPV